MTPEGVDNLAGALFGVLGGVFIVAVMAAIRDIVATGRELAALRRCAEEELVPTTPPATAVDTVDELLRTYYSIPISTQSASAYDPIFQEQVGRVSAAWRQRVERAQREATRALEQLHFQATTHETGAPRSMSGLLDMFDLGIHREAGTQPKARTPKPHPKRPWEDA